MVSAKEDPEQMVQHLLLKSPIGHLLDWAYRSGNENDLIKRYLHDFVYMVYKPQSKDPEAEIKVTELISASKIFISQFI